MQAAEYASKRAHATMHPSTGVDPTKNHDTYWKTALLTEERDWEKVPPPARDTFTLSDILGQTDPHLAVVSRTGLVGMSLQYYQLPGETECRQHFFFELNENVLFADEDGNRCAIHGFAMWMAPTTNGKAELTVRLCIKSDPWMDPLLIFDFYVERSKMDPKENFILIDFINALQGDWRQVAWISRCSWMIRLTIAKFLSWSCHGMDFEEANFAGDGEYMGDLEFDVIIYNKFKSDPNELGDNMKRIIDVTKTPIKRGVWLDESFTRPLAFRLAKLPYEGPPAWRDALTNASVDKWFEGIDDWFATGEFAKE
ncbi:uncharacterized protein FMAN_12288 [Fusarium mangiferae]|uniref:Uncharacterized protein n=1 Tax=Fusarium mangiferae TaxID=192010 RepID=A0A1L7TTT4_FUSMA|nr:uncharacterized protein FMAN_12288 [Fusarium mangiferae]CVK98246.1 uncharacterized protein FMAN_12288 [Fusarium mangiferae]